jgi:hypothetical protein
VGDADGDLEDFMHRLGIPEHAQRIDDIALLEIDHHA